MATRIHPLPAPAEPASPHLEPNAEMLLAPPPKLSKRLTAAVHRSLPGWTVQVVVKRWTDQRVKVVVTGQRDADALAPPAPPTGSPEAEKLANRAARLVENAKELEQPGTEWSVVPGYSSPNQSRFRLDLVGEIGKPHDPPTCVDGDGEVIFPGEAYLVSETGFINLKYETPKTPPGSMFGATTDRCVYFHWHGEPGPIQFPSGAVLRPYPVLHQRPAPTLMYANAVVQLSTSTFVHILTAGSPSLDLKTVELTDWWVWWWSN